MGHGYWRPSWNIAEKNNLWSYHGTSRMKSSYRIGTEADFAEPARTGDYFEQEWPITCTSCGCSSVLCNPQVQPIF